MTTFLKIQQVAFGIFVMAICRAGAADELAASAEATDTAVQGHEVSQNPCDGITCSAQGRCVQFREFPTCACNPGFVPDGVNGLHCVPATPVKKSPTIRNDVSEVKPFVKDKKLEVRYKGYLRAVEEGRFSGYFSHYLEEIYVQRRKLGRGLLATGIVFLSATPFFGMPSWLMKRYSHRSARPRASVASP